MKFIWITLLSLTPIACFAQKQKHIVHSPAYHTTHRPPLKDEPIGDPKIRKESFKEDKVWLCSSNKSRTYHSEEDCVELRFCRAGVILLKKDDAVLKEERRPCAKCYSR